MQRCYYSKFMKSLSGWFKVNQETTMSLPNMAQCLKEGIWNSFEEMVHEIITEALLPIMVLTFCKCCDKTEPDLENAYKNHKSPWKYLLKTPITTFLCLSPFSTSWSQKRIQWRIWEMQKSADWMLRHCSFCEYFFFFFFFFLDPLKMLTLLCYFWLETSSKNTCFEQKIENKI